MRTSGFAAALAVAIVGIGLSNSASASLVSYKISNTSTKDLLLYVGLKVDGVSVNDYVGGLKLTKVSGDAGMPSTYVSLCTDVNGVLKSGATYTFEQMQFAGLEGTAPKWGNPVSPASAAQAIQNAAYLFDNFRPASADNTDANRVAWAALQLATWEALYDSPGSGTFSLTTGRFAASSGPAGSLQASAVAQAQQLLADLSAHIPAPGTYAGSLLVPSPGVQGGVIPQALMFEPTAAAGISPVPESSTLLAGLLLLIPVGTYCLRGVRTGVAKAVA